MGLPWLLLLGGTAVTWDGDLLSQKGFPQPWATTQGGTMQEVVRGAHLLGHSS